VYRGVLHTFQKYNGHKAINTKFQSDWGVFFLQQAAVSLVHFSNAEIAIIPGLTTTHFVLIRLDKNIFIITRLIIRNVCWFIGILICKSQNVLSEVVSREVERASLGFILVHWVNTSCNFPPNNVLGLF
jgi:hypothetical protein